MPVFLGWDTCNIIHSLEAAVRLNVAEVVGIYGFFPHFLGNSFHEMEFDFLGNELSAVTPLS